MDDLIAFIVVNDQYGEKLYIAFREVESFAEDRDGNAVCGSYLRTKTGQGYYLRETAQEIMDKFHQIAAAV